MTGTASSSAQAKPPDKLPSTGSEVPLIRVKASPRDYIDERFPIVGHAKISDYYNWGYRTAQATHYSIQFVDAHGGRTIAHLYLKRGIGDGLAEQLTRNVEHGILATPIRAVVSLDSDRQPSADTWDMLEMHDVQFLESDNGWGLPLLAAAVNVRKQLHRYEKDAAPGLAASLVAADDTAFQRMYVSCWRTAKSSDRRSLKQPAKNTRPSRTKLRPMKSSRPLPNVLRT